jgi:hypothetical protein
MYSYNNKESINKDIIILSLSKNNIKNNNLYNILFNFIIKIIDLLYYYNLLLNFKNILT